jgi:hypothetical protein
MHTRLQHFLRRALACSDRLPYAHLVLLIASSEIERELKFGADPGTTDWGTIEPPRKISIVTFSLHDERILFRCPESKYRTTKDSFQKVP